MDLSNKGTLKNLFIPGGVLLLAAVVLLEGGFITSSASAATFYYFAVFGVGVLLAWRFHSSRVLFALVTLLLAHRALDFFSSGRVASIGPGRIAFEAISVLVPLNFIVFSWARERGMTVPAVAPRLGLLFFEAVFVAILCRPGQKIGPALLHAAPLPRALFHWTSIPQPALLVFLAAIFILLTRFIIYRKPLESGLLWSLAAVLLSLRTGGLDRVANAYWATAGLLLVASIIENSYILVYHDELTTLPARRAFNHALLQLDPPYSVAVVDIDHFKNFNDSYGHDTGDQVLRMVAAALARVTGGGEAFRVGGEEFSILFRGKSIKESLPHLESLRSSIEAAKFRLRGSAERRTVARGPDRRIENQRTASRRKKNHPLDARTPGELSVTVSIGVAEPTAKTKEVEEVIQAADKALYRAKHSGRNRVETSSSTRVRTSRLRRSIA